MGQFHRVSIRGALLIAVCAMWFTIEDSYSASSAVQWDLAELTFQLAPIADPDAAFEAWAAERSAGVSGATIFSPDERVQVADTTKAGWRAIVYLMMYDGSKLVSTCSGSMLNYNVILTAAHCLWSPDATSPHTSVLVVPAAHPPFKAPYGTATATRFSIPTGWAKLSGFERAAYDVALLHLDDAPFGDDIAPYLRIASVPDSYLEGTTGLATAGYPGDLSAGIDGSMWTSKTHVYAFDESTIFTQLDIFAGQSGSPIYTFTEPPTAAYVVSVVSFGTSTHNQSIRFTPAVIDALKSYCQNNDCEFETGVIPVSYSVATYAFCHGTQACPNGPEPLVAGKPVTVGFEIAPPPAEPVGAEISFNGIRLTQARWSSVSGPTRFYLTHDVIGSLPSGGTIELRFTIGGRAIGSISATVAPPPAPSPSPTSAATVAPSVAPSTTASVPAQSNKRAMVSGLARDTAATKTPTVTPTPKPSPTPTVDQFIKAGSFVASNASLLKSNTCTFNVVPSIYWDFTFISSNGQTEIRPGDLMQVRIDTYGGESPVYRFTYPNFKFSTAVYRGAFPGAVDVDITFTSPTEYRVNSITERYVAPTCQIRWE